MDKAIKKFEEYLSIKPNDHSVLLKMGEAYTKKGLIQTESSLQKKYYQMAISFYEKDAKINNSNEAKTYLSRVQKLLNEEEEPLEELEPVENDDVLEEIDMTNKESIGVYSNDKNVDQVNDLLSSNSEKDLGRSSSRNITLSDSSISKPVNKIGKMEKQGGGTSIFGRKSWKNRVFVLNGDYIKYYAKSSTEKPKGSISISWITDVVIYVDSEAKFKKPFVFEICTNERAFPIACKTKSEMEDWVKAIKTNVKLKKGK